jgi:phosphatidyl-myo-inositol dimannoside synthase
VTARHLLVTNDFPPKVGGIQSYLWDLWSQLDPESFAVLTASSHPEAAAFDVAQAGRGLRVDRVPGRILYFPSPWVRRRVRTLAAETGASLVVFDPVLPLGLLGPSLGMPYGVVLHGAELAVPARLPASRQLLAHVLAGASLVVSAGSYPAAEAGRVLGHRPTNSVWVDVPPGVDCERYEPFDPAAKGAARDRLGLPASGPLVASVSRLVPRKGMDVLVEACRRLSGSWPDLVLAIAGAGRAASALESQTRRTSAPSRFLGSVPEDDKALLLGAADVFAMACRHRWGGLEQEGFGIVFIEAAAAGVPQVAGDSGGVAEAVVDGVTGLVVRNPEDPGAVAAAIRRLLSDGALRERMGHASRRRACTDYDQASLAAKLALALAEVQG